MKAFCNRLAESGFLVFAPDLYHGKVTDTIAEAESWSGNLFANLEQARADVAEAATFLSEQASNSETGLAVVGFSLGAFFALDLSDTAPEHLHSVVLFYGTRPGDYSNSHAAYLGHFAETDEFEPQSEVENLEALLRRANRPVTFHHYPGTGHWFFEPDRSDAYNEVAANLAWERTLEFLNCSFTS